MATAAFLTLAAPVAMYGAVTEPTPVARSVRLPSDTSAKTDKAKGAQSPNVRKKPLRGKQATPPVQARPDARQYGPDQPWETEFYVSNDVTLSSPPFFLASIHRVP